MSASVKGLWTKADLAEARRLADACQADGAHWALADWLLLKEPLRESSDRNGCYGRIAALALELDWTAQSLRNLRRAAFSWPPEHRVGVASFAAHARYTTGGAAKAAQRAKRLAAAPRTRFGKVRTMQAPSDTPDRQWSTLNCAPEIHAAVVAEARALGLNIRDLTGELITEALGARAWLAEEVAA